MNILFPPCAPTIKHFKHKGQPIYLLSVNKVPEKHLTTLINSHPSFRQRAGLNITNV